MPEQELLDLQETETTVIARLDFLAHPYQYWLPDEPMRLEEFEANLVPQLAREIESRFQERVSSIFSDDATVVVARVQPGSIWGTVLIVAAAGLEVYEFVSKYKDFRESCRLLGRHLESIIQTVLHRALRHRVAFRTDVVVSPSSVTASRPLKSARWVSRFSPGPLVWYLVLTNIVFMGVIGFLMYRALSIVYFPPP